MRNVVLSVLFSDGRDISGSRHVLVHRHQVDEAHGLLRLVHGATNEDLAVSDRRPPIDTCICETIALEICRKVA